MKTMSLLSLLCLAASAPFAQTQPEPQRAARTWVSGVGDDVNPCSRTAPCKTFAGAIGRTLTGGEISVLDPGGYGTVIITKSITIDGTASLSSQLATAGAVGVTINITDPADKTKAVRIRGVSINGAGSGLHGIRIISAASVSIGESVISGFTGDGIRVDAPSAQVFVTDTSISNNAGAGITVGPGSEVALSNVALFFNVTGLSAAAGGTLVSFGNNTLFGNRKDGSAMTAAVRR